MRSDLEEQLLREWTPANLEAFGAALREAEHPRGELIAIDFVLERERGAHVRIALAEEKRAFQIAWLGDHGANLTTKFGFVEDIHEESEHMPVVIELVAPYARSLDIWGDAVEVCELLEIVARASRPWLRSLRTRTYGERTEIVVDNALGQRLIAATPNLHRLHASGHLVFDQLPHPAVELLVADGHDAIGALRGRGTMPNVRTLDLAFHPDFPVHREPPPDVLREGFIPRAAFPQLACLDVSRNEPRERTLVPNCLGGNTPLFDVLPLFAIVPHVIELRVPSLRSPAHARALQAAMERMPQLRRVEVARAYGTAPVAPKHALIASKPSVPWPAGTELREYDALMFQAGPDWVRFDLGGAYKLMELHYDQLPANERVAWTTFWQLVRTLGVDDEQKIEMIAKRDLQTLCNSLANVGHEFWDPFGKRFLDHEAHSVPVRRIRGFESTDENLPSTPRIVASSESILAHERALQEHWDLERLAVYADELQQHGDLRGELIALDLRKDPDLSYEHDQLHDQIFGSHRYNVSSKLGLSIVDMGSYNADEDGAFENVFQGDVARYLGELELRGNIGWIEEALGHVLAEPRPWLRTLRIHTSRTGDARLELAREQPRWPHLEALELGIDDDLPLLAGYVHPNVRRMHVTGIHGFAPLGAPWSSLTELDFAFGTDEDADGRDPPPLFTHKKLPALRALDLSRNEPTGPTFAHHERHQCALPVFYPQLAQVDDALLADLRRLVLPSPRSPEDVAAIQATLDCAPNLESLVIARRYPRGPDVVLAHPRARLAIPTPSTWPPFDRVVARSAFAVDKVILPIAAAVTAMESFYDRLAEPGRRAWDELWSLADDPLRAQFPMPAQTLYTAVDALLAVHRYQPAWVQELATHLHPLALAQKTITVKRAAER